MKPGAQVSLIRLCFTACGWKHKVGYNGVVDKFDAHTSHT